MKIMRIGRIVKVEPRLEDVLSFSDREIILSKFCGTV